ncbi:MAG TPA: nuclear transport factor 2 family protein [Phnomibacter sp.]|nr:nuclear transport factor 2 family protein [Phnomibacter sp.]
MPKNIFALLLLICATTCVWAQQTPAEKFVAALAKQKNTWLVKKQLDSVQLLLDSRCLYIHSNGWQQDAKEVIEDTKSGKLIYQSVSIDYKTARQYEKMVIVNGLGKIAGTMQGTPFAIQLNVTEVYVNRKNGWKLVSRHASKLPD